MYEEMFLANTNIVSLISPESVVNAHAYGTAKLGQKILKDVATNEANIFPDSAFGTQIDAQLQRNGLPPRFGAIESTTYLRIVADPGTIYDHTTVTFTGKHGEVFELEATFTMNALGFDYKKVRSTGTGVAANVDPLTINRIVNPPTGHRYVLNEYRAQGGQDTEDDELARRRLKEGVNILATGTLAKYEQVFMKVNPRVLRIYNGGMNGNGQFVIYVSSVNGVNFNSGEFATIVSLSNQYLSLTEQQAGLELRNVAYYPIDVSLRAILQGGADIDRVRLDMQVAMQKHVDWRFWEFGDTVEWDDLLAVAKRIRGVDYVFDNFFTPGSDLVPPAFELPRIRSFTLYDENGVILSSSASTLNPLFYPNQPQFITQQTLFNSIP
jgi:hypothetical protein